MDLIDPELTLSQFEALPPEIVAPLCEATATDLRDWGQRLLDAVAGDDPDAIRRARHSLKGLCGNFGASAVMRCADGDLQSADARARFHECIEATIATILALAAPLIPQ
ncbi:Hpt domain-containing protein [Novosphingobium sp. FKTRR1]|uniref:Hpt domain-containing protein n=1 Tax=Novosphingobium sp. FKTRR1 TaxID=2879118 RepID=UPI001CF07B9C|nr:Hpt domain-containing protein [Novosphingobium sp. FKTRR1]